MTTTKDAKPVKPKKGTQSFPPGWNEAKVRAVIEHYDNLTDEERAREIEEAVEIEDQTTMSVPTELVPAIAQLIDDYKQGASNARTRNPRATKVHSKTTRKPAPR